MSITAGKEKKKIKSKGNGNSRVLWVGVGSVFHRKTNPTLLVFRYTSSTHGVDGPTVTRNLSGWGGVGGQGPLLCAMDGAIEPPGTGLRRVLPTHTAPPNQQKPRAALAFEFALA
ncbi:hypothetical protein [Stenotrophomonas maltophilia]|uniref:hypothetical protein n=1 Tax=Stenotrophomonas maltophilia TaxID=40324 RepID=UPI00167BA553|nr:hypothetical protein [Stenotrophomonas maltophilia]